nr:MAG TPA: hypothetical protein [Caudoviricetes sp.]
MLHRPQQKAQYLFADCKRNGSFISLLSSHLESNKSFFSEKEFIKPRSLDKSVTLVHNAAYRQYRAALRTDAMGLKTEV